MYSNYNLESTNQKKHNEAGGRMSAKGGSASGGKFESTNIFINLSLLSFLIFSDQLSKYIIRFSGGFYVCNQSLAFGLNLKYNLPLIFLALVALLIFLNSKFKGQNAKLQFKMQNYFPFLLILSGGLSNITDRIYYGCVVDFIDLKFWPVFNLADVFITVGVILLIMQKSNIKNKNGNVK